MDEETNDIAAEDVELEEDIESEPTDDPSELKARIKKLEDKAIAQRERTRLLRQELKSKDKPADAKAEDKPGELDFSRKAYLAANGIKGADELALVQEAAKDTGKDIDALLESKWFQAQLKDLREARETKDATPSGTRRSNVATRDSVEYWIAKGELPPPDQRDLREKVVNARMKKESSPFG